LDVMLREARTPKVHDWLVNYVVKKNPHSEELRLAWSADPDPVVASAGWALTTERVAKKPEGLDLAGLLDVIEAAMRDAPDRLQWAMNHCLAQIGIEHAEHRVRAIDIGERLEVLKDYPTPPNCTSPFAPHLDHRDGAPTARQLGRVTTYSSGVTRRMFARRGIKAVIPQAPRRLSRDRTRCPRCPASRCTTRPRHRQPGAARGPRRARPVVHTRPRGWRGALHPRALCRPARQDAPDS
jgi:hypothetical protein